MPQIKVGWVGNYRRINKRFDVAFHVCNTYGYKLKVAGFLNTMLHIPHKGMPDFYRDTDVLLVTSMLEAHPLVVYEALSCEVPVTMLPIGDCVAENVPGIHYYDYLDPKKIAQSIETTYENREELGRKGRREIVKKWQWKHWIPRYTQMFQDVTQRKDDIRLAIIIDKPKWAWDIMVNIIKRELLKTRLYKVIDIYYVRGVDRETAPSHISVFNHTNYDVILNHFWHIYNHRKYRRFPHDKTIPCVNGHAYCEKQWEDLFSEVVSKAPVLTSVSRLIVRDLKKRLRVRQPVYHCSRGVDTTMFRPARLLQSGDRK